MTDSDISYFVLLYLTFFHWKYPIKEFSLSTDRLWLTVSKTLALQDSYTETES